MDLLSSSLYHALSIYFVPVMHAVTLAIASCETDFDYFAPFFYELLPPFENIQVVRLSEAKFLVQYLGNSCKIITI